MAQGSSWRTAGVLIVAALVTVGFAYFTSQPKHGEQAAPAAPERQASASSEDNAPYLRAADSANAAQASSSAKPTTKGKLIDATLEVERKYRELDAFRDIRGQSTVIVGDSFFRIEYAVKLQACTAVSQARGVLGLSRDYFLREPMNNRRVGYFNGASLEME